MKCPHCLVEFHPSKEDIYIGEDEDGKWGIIKFICAHPNCKRIILVLAEGNWARQPAALGGKYYLAVPNKSYYIKPKGISRSPLPLQVSDKYAEDYKEACLVLSDSPKASAALSRRCLQLLLRDVAKVKHGNLYDEIQEIIGRGSLPTYISESLDAVRTIGNFGAHPIKSRSTGEIVPVEAGEAEWNLDVLEALFDFYFVQPEIIKQKKAALNKKLEDAGKEPIS